jgi:hypothetical protein
MEGILATADPISKLLSQKLPFTRSGPVQIRLCDLHTLQQRFYFDNSAAVFMASAVASILRPRLLQAQRPIVIVLCDDGANKRYSQMFRESYPLIVFNKIRDGEERHVSLKDSWMPSCDAPFVLKNKSGALCFPEEAEYVLVDDLVQTGSTLLETARALRQMGARHISAFVPHAVFPNGAWRRFMLPLPGDDQQLLIQRFWVCDTVPKTAEVLRRAGGPFEVLSVVRALVPPSTEPDVNFSSEHPCILASKSPEKTGALQRLLSKPEQQLIPVSAKSGVSEQPQGRIETWLGASNRFIAARRAVMESARRGGFDTPSADAATLRIMTKAPILKGPHMIVAVENGAIPHPKNAEQLDDVACVEFASSGTGKLTVRWSRPTTFPADAVKAWREAPDRAETTIGHHLAKLHPGVSNTNWSRDLYGPQDCRIGIIEKTLLEAEVINHAYDV